MSRRRPVVAPPWVVPAVLVAIFAVASSSCGARTSLGEPTSGSAGGPQTSQSHSSHSSSHSTSSLGGFGGSSTIDFMTSTSDLMSSTSFIDSTGTTGTFSSSVSSMGGFGGGTTMNPVISITPDSFIESETSVVAAPDGTVVVTWITVPQSQQSSIGYAISTDDGASFAAPQQLLSPGGREASNPVVVVDAAGNFYVTWVGYFIQGQNPTNMHVYVAKGSRTAGGVVFGSPVEASAPGQNNNFYDKPWIGITGQGSLIVTYSNQTTTNSYNLVAARSADGGQTWTQSNVAHDPTLQTFRNLAYPCTTQTPGRFYVSYLNFPTNGVDLTVGLGYSDDDGVTWADPAAVALASQPGETVAFDDPTCASAGNDVWVSYGLTPDSPGQFESDKSNVLQLAHSADAGASFASHLSVGDASSPFYLHAQMAREPGGGLDFTMYGGTHNSDNNGHFVWSRTANPNVAPAPGLSIEHPIVFTQARSSARWLGDYTGIYTQGGKVYMSYAVNTTGQAHIAFAKQTIP